MRGLHAVFSNMLAGQGLVRAAAAAPGIITPTAPGPNDVFNEGANCTFTWTPDPSGTWKQTDVELMTGDNFNMVFLTTVASFDGTDPSLTEFSYPCPGVEPNAAIYFYQFSSPAVSDRTWTTRFAIADAQGDVTPPPNDTQPDGQKIGWGTGRLADPSKAVPAPSYLQIGSGAPGGGNTTTNATAGSGSGSATGSGTASPTGTVTTTDSDDEVTRRTSLGSGSATTPTTNADKPGTVTNTITDSPSSPTGGSGSGNGTNTGGDNGALAVRAGWGPVFALGLTAIGFSLVL